ncbi:MAG TPA: hypothetical protein VMA83_04640 [Solirubrobacteraceae bacterium]|nr:hypothetical protein [Solirubrobacteraceae bacterium]
MTGKLLRGPSIALLAVVAAVALGACGSNEERVTTGTYAGESGKNAPYLDVGPLVYQVQLSRALNPYSQEDATYLEGLTPRQRFLKPGEEWFAVFLQVRNPTSYPHVSTLHISIYDTQNNTYYPMIPPGANEYAYRGEVVPANNQIPVAGSVAAMGPTGGQVLLFRIKYESLNNRPLTLKLTAPGHPSQFAQATLDV